MLPFLEKLVNGYIPGWGAYSEYAAVGGAEAYIVNDMGPGTGTRGYRMPHAKDCMVYRLTGRFLTDYSDASGMNLFDLREKCWSEGICRVLDIPMGLPVYREEATSLGPPSENMMGP